MDRSETTLTKTTAPPVPVAGGSRCRCQGGRGSGHGGPAAACSDAPRPSPGFIVDTAESLGLEELDAEDFRDRAEFAALFGVAEVVHVARRLDRLIQDLRPCARQVSMMDLHFALEKVQAAVREARTTLLPSCNNDFPTVVRGELTAAALRADHP